MCGVPIPEVSAQLEHRRQVLHQPYYKKYPYPALMKLLLFSVRRLLGRTTVESPAPCSDPSTGDVVFSALYDEFCHTNKPLL